MGRTAKSKELDTTRSDFNPKRMDEAEQTTRQLVQINQETEANATALAEQLGYVGSLTVGAVEDEIRFYQKQTGEALFEMGKRLLILKELTPHGEFVDRLYFLGIEYKNSQRIMAIARKFSNRSALSILNSAQTQSKLLELLVLDDSEIEELEAGETVRGLDLDKIETMSVRELKAALRESEADLAASRKRVGVKEAEIETKTKELARAKQRFEKETPDEVAAELREEVTQETFGAEAAIMGSLRPAIQALIEHGQANDQLHEEFIVGQLCQIEVAISTVRRQFMLKDKPDGDERPDWVKPDADEIQAKKLAEINAKNAKKNK